MLDAAQTGLLPAHEVARSTPLTTAANGLRYASFGYNEVSLESLRQIVEAVPPVLAASLSQRAYYFVPLAIGETEETEIAPGFTLDLGDRATCHRDVLVDAVECTFISARLMQDRFALAFEFFINVGHQLVDTAGVPQRFQELAWAQARGEVRGETSQDAYEARKQASAPARSPGLLSQLSAESRFGGRSESRSSRGGESGRGGRAATSAESPHEAAGTNVPHLLPGTDEGRTGMQGEQPADQAAGEQASIAFFEAAFADTLAIYMLSLAMDLDYADLREREYPLLAAPALADRLRLAAELFPPAPGYEFSIRYRRRH